jgi:hypothetical protein
VPILETAQRLTIAARSTGVFTVIRQEKFVIREEQAREIDSFTRQAEEAQHGTLRELLDLIWYNRKWWLTPIMIALLLVAILIVVGGTAAAPLIYTLF